MEELSQEEQKIRQKKLKSRYILNQGTFMGLALAGAYYVAHLAGIMDSFFHRLIAWGIYIGFIHVSMQRFRDRFQNGLLTYGQGVWLGTRMGILAGIILGAFMFFYLKVINPGYLEEMVIRMQESSLEMGMSENEVAMMDQIYELTANPLMMVTSGILGTGLGAFILSLVISIFVQKKGDPFSDTMKNVE